MSLLKPRVMTPARWAANRRNAEKSTGPQTARGKAQSRLNGLRHGYCSPLFRQLWLAFFEAPPGTPVAKTVFNLLTPAESFHPVYANLIEVHFEMEMVDRECLEQRRRQRARLAAREAERSPERIENIEFSKNMIL